MLTSKGVVVVVVVVGGGGGGVYWYDLVRPGARLSAPVVPVIPWCIRLTRIFHHVC